ncbi:hypothetical protein [Amycolatopsis suaedae]|uniref:Uncharacterized protein n=1 Tax=Amycolatopsis suaedae TaxID=2510978 RepID=A0A4V2EKZ8_9PSEU|nr:hypothetical protein [Amycolatopsis suaedae]RZQ59815.1 hypothetical protein EWH70_32385 [Amycolatopsis suaedae]
MNAYDYECCQKARGLSFPGLIMAAMFAATEPEFARLRAAFPEIYAELQVHESTPGPGDRVRVVLRDTGEVYADATPVDADGSYHGRPLVEAGQAVVAKRKWSLRRRP